MSVGTELNPCSIPAVGCGTFLPPLSDGSQSFSQALVKGLAKDADGNVIQEAPMPIWANFRRRALDVAIAEINKKTDLKIKLASIKRSKHRRVVALDFAIKTQPILKGATRSECNRKGPGRSGLGCDFGAIMKEAGITGRILRERSGKGRYVRSLTFHSFRHTAAPASTMPKAFAKSKCALRITLAAVFWITRTVTLS
jgi:hypothetical protein